MRPLAKKVSTLNVAEVPEGAMNITSRASACKPDPAREDVAEDLQMVRLPLEHMSPTDLIAT